MPVISRFNGITIKMYFRRSEHNSPHIHAIYGEYIGVFEIAGGEMIEGDLPGKEQRMVKAFIEKYKGQLVQMWETQNFAMLPMV